MSDKIEIKITVRTDRVGSEDERVVEFDREEWQDMDEMERKEACLEIMIEMVQWDYEEVD